MSSVKAIEATYSKCRDLAQEYMSKDLESLPDTDRYNEGGWIVSYRKQHAHGNNYIIQIQCKKSGIGGDKVVGFVEINDVNQQILVGFDRQNMGNDRAFTPTQRRWLESRGFNAVGRGFQRTL